MNYADATRSCWGSGSPASRSRAISRARGARVRVADTRADAADAAGSRAALPGVPLVTGPFTAPTLAGADLIAISPGVAEGSAADRRRGRARRGARRRHRALRARAAAGAEGARDHRHQRQDDGDGADRRALPRSRARDGRRRQHRRCRARRARRQGRALARCLGARAVELPARDDGVARAGRRDGAQRHREPPRLLRRHRRLRRGEGAHLRARRHAGAQPRRPALARDAPARAHSCRRSAPACRSRRRHGASSSAGTATGAGDVARARRRAARCRRGLASRRPPQRAERARRAGARVGGREARRGVLAALARFEGLPHRVQHVAEAGGVLYVDDSKGTTVAATKAALEGLERPVVLIAGGDGKGQDFAPLRAGRRRALPRGAADRPRRAGARARARGHAGPVEQLGTLEPAVARAVALARARRRRAAVARRARASTSSATTRARRALRGARA